MQGIFHWPSPLLRKWLMLVLISLGCLAVGTIMLILNEDKVLLCMSDILALLTVGRCVLLYRKISHGEYEVMEGVCLSTKWSPLQHLRLLCLITQDGEKRFVSISQKAPLQMGRLYRVYILEHPQLMLSTDIQGETIRYSAFAIEDLGEKRDMGPNKDKVIVILFFLYQENYVHIPK